MSCLPLPGEDMIVLHDCFLNPVGGRQGLLTTLFSVCFNLTDLSTMSSPLPLCVINLEKKILVGLPKALHLFLSPWIPIS